SICTDGGQNGGSPYTVVEAAIPAGNLEACGQPLDVPLERSGMRLVEIVEIEDEIPGRRCKAAKIGQVGVAAELCLETCSRRSRKVVRHKARCTSVEGERRYQHSAVTNGHQLGNTRGGIGIDDCYRVAIAGELEYRVARARCLLSCGLSASDPLGYGQVSDLRVY